MLWLSFLAKKILFLSESVSFLSNWCIIFAIYSFQVTLIVSVLAILVFLLSVSILLFLLSLINCYSHRSRFIKKYFHSKPTPNTLARFFFIVASVSFRDFRLCVKLANEANQYLSEALKQKYGFGLKLGEVFEKRLLFMEDDARKALLDELSSVSSNEQYVLKILTHIVGKNEDEIIEKRSWKNRLHSFYINIIVPLLTAINFFLSILTIVLRLLGRF